MVSILSTSEEFLQRHPGLLDEDRTSPDALRSVVRWAAPLAAYFRFTMSGWENLPSGPCIIAANHSVGSPFVLPLLARAWQIEVPHRQVRGLMHRVAWQGPAGKWALLQRLGGVYAHRVVAQRALDRGHSLLVFPGGEVDAMRPFGARYRVRFGGRTGFVRLAREARVPIVPLAICGSHAAYVVLPGAGTAARALGLARSTGLKGFPLTIGACAVAAMICAPPLWPFAPIAAGLALAPLPTRIEAQLLPPIYSAEGESDVAAAEHVRTKLESALQRMAASRRTFLG
jgi:hypothetical protein